MKIIENNYRIKNTQDYICENCNSKINVEDEELLNGVYGLKYFICPCCNKKSYTDIETVLTHKNLKFPTNFHHFSKDYGAKELDDSEIEKYIRNCIDKLREDKESPYRYISSGDSFVCVFKHDDDEESFTIVAKDFYDVYLKIEDCENA